MNIKINICIKGVEIRDFELTLNIIERLPYISLILRKIIMLFTRKHIAKCKAYEITSAIDES